MVLGGWDPRTWIRKELVRISPPFISAMNETAIWKREFFPRSRGLTVLTMVNSLLNGMILQVDPSFNPSNGMYFFCFWLLGYHYVIGM